MACEYELLGICLTRPPADSGIAIFGFAEFLAALALLVLVFNSSDFLYRFRISIAPLPLFTITFVATLAIGLGTLLTDLWFAERWYSLPWSVSRSMIQAIFGLLFLSTALLWIWFAFIRPPIFGRWNSKRFCGAVYRALVRGSEAELPILASELGRSGESLVALARSSYDDRDEKKPTAADYAHQALFMLGNRKLCRHIVASAPVTAIIIMEEATKLKKYDVPLGQFASSVTTEAILNKDSILYHEDNYGSDMIGHMQPFSTAMYGDYKLVDRSEGSSPLDVDFRVTFKWDAEQFGAFCRITLVTFKGYIDTGWYLNQSTALFRAFDQIKRAGGDLYKLNDAPSGAYDSDARKRLAEGVDFIADAIDFLATKEDLRFGRLRIGKPGAVDRSDTIFDDIADLMFEMVHDAGALQSPPDLVWWIQHNTIWSKFFTFRKPSKAWSVIRFKFFRLIFDEIKHMEKVPNYKGARVLAFCLNVLGVNIPKRSDYSTEYYALRVAVINWTRRHYLRLVREHPEIAKHCLAGGMSYDPDNQGLVKTFASTFGQEPARHYLELQEPTQRKPAEAAKQVTQKPRKTSSVRKKATL